MSTALQTGITFLRQGRLVDAGAEFCAAAEAEPANALAHHLAGFVMLQTGALEAGLASIRRAIALNPHDPVAFRHLGKGLRDAGAYDEALEAYASARALGLNDAEINIDEGSAHWSADRLAEAVACYDRALAIDPNLAEAWSSRAMALRFMERHEEALESIERAITLDPAAALHRGDRAMILSDLGRYAEAIEDYRAGLALDPDLQQMRASYAFACLATGDFERGWPLYESRWRGRLLDTPTSGPPFWDGVQPLEGKTILLRCEQGLGDALQFCRYVSLVKALGAGVLLETYPPLVELFRTLDGVDGLCVMGEPLPDADFQCLLMSLPLFMGTRLQSIPVNIPYLRADAAKVQAWRERLGPAKRLRVGLVWSGGERTDHSQRWANRRRNIPLALLAPLNGLDVDFISLQKGEPAAGELPELKQRNWAGPDIVEAMDGVADFADTAALLETLDLVISVDTSTAHLAGALGKPVWLLNRYDSCWRWLTLRDDSPWYPSLTLFRQSGFGEWERVVARVRHALVEVTAGGRAL